MATLVNELERSDGRYGLQVMCEGGGMANATIIERLSSDPLRALSPLSSGVHGGGAPVE